MKKWTRFMDMSSGGNHQEKHAYIYIEASEDEARVIFYNRFGHSADRVTCNCCGRDYSVNEFNSLKELLKYENSEKDVLHIFDEDIKPEERLGEVPEESYE